MSTAVSYQMLPAVIAPEFRISTYLSAMFKSAIDCAVHTASDEQWFRALCGMHDRGDLSLQRSADCSNIMPLFSDARVSRRLNTLIGATVAYERRLEMGNINEGAC